MIEYAKKYVPDIYDFYCSYIKDHGYCPSYRTVSEKTGICLVYVTHAMSWLRQNGYIKELKKGLYVLTDKEFKGVL